ncbi:MAG TPA: hypothetical protein VFP47_02190, partial [Pyrinomonadaceae bacterium]|nr:hypothetical protein [Pyrinomonadaceae bacterium]
MGFENAVRDLTRSSVGSPMMISTATAAIQTSGPIALGAKKHLLSLLPLLAVYLLLALYGIERQSLWQDEFHSLERVSSSIPFWKDGHGFLYYAFLAVWVQLGTSEFIVRSLSVLFGAVAVSLIYALGHILLNGRSA